MTGSEQTFYFVAERTSTRKGCTQNQQDLISVKSESFRKADQWINANYKNWTHWHTDTPKDFLFTATSFKAFTA